MSKKNFGFTLIELLIAIGILAMVAILGWRGLDSIVRSREVLTAELETTRGLQLTFAQMQSDCSQIASPLIFSNLPEGRSSWIEPQRLILIRNVFIDGQAPSMQVVTYQLKKSTLTRFESITTRDLSVLNQLLLQARIPPENQVEVAMQKNVQRIEFSGWPQNTLSNNSVNLTNSSSSSTANAYGSGIQNVDPSTVTTGLQVSIQLIDHKNVMSKIFILGGF